MTAPPDTISRDLIRQRAEVGAKSLDAGSARPLAERGGDLSEHGHRR